MDDILDPAPPWDSERSRYVILWHGCTALDKAGIEANGIDLARSRVNLDFGRGFYTTTIERQARYWAWRRYYRQNPSASENQAVVLRFRVRRELLGKLVSMHFVVGDYNDEDYWSLVQHCRRSIPASSTEQAVVHEHARPRTKWYDMVMGPVAAAWEQRVTMKDYDQISFHTPRAIGLLDNIIIRGSFGDYAWYLVT